MGRRRRWVAQLRPAGRPVCDRPPCFRARVFGLDLSGGNEERVSARPVEQLDLFVCSHVQTGYRIKTRKCTLVPLVRIYNIDKCAIEVMTDD